MRVGKDQAEIRVEAQKVTTRRSASAARKNDSAQSNKPALSAKAKRALKASATKTEPPASRKQSVVKGGFTAQSARSLGAKKVEAKPAQGLTGTPTKKRDAKALEKEKSSAKKMTDKEFLKFCAEVQSAGVTSVPKAKAVDPITAVKGKALASAVASKRLMSALGSAASKRKRV